jgi:hypothetical protein
MGERTIVTYLFERLRRGLSLCVTCHAAVPRGEERAHAEWHQHGAYPWPNPSHDYFEVNVDPKLSPFDPRTTSASSSPSAASSSEAS